MHFLQNQFSDVNHIWQKWSFDDSRSVQFMCFMTSDHFVWLPWQHEIKKKKKKRFFFLNDNSAKTIEAVWL